MGVEKKSNKIIIITVITAVLAIALAVAAVILVINKGGNKLEKHLSLGQKYLEEGDYEEAIAEFEKALEIDPMCVEAYEGIANAYMELGDYESAREVLEEALELFEDEGKKSDIRKINKLIDAVDEAEAENDFGGTEEAAAEEYPDADTEIAEGDTEEAQNDIDNNNALREYWNNIVRGSDYIKINEVFTAECKAERSSQNDSPFIYTPVPVTGYVNSLIFDFDMDGENELVTAYYNTNDTFSIEIYEAVNGQVIRDFTIASLPANLCGTSDQDSISYGICQKNGKTYIVVEHVDSCSIFADGEDIQMEIYEVSGGIADCVFSAELVGSDFYEVEYTDEFIGYQNELRALGFNSTADSLTYQLKFSDNEGIIPLIFAHARHSSSYRQGFNYDAFWNGDPNPDAGEKAFIFAETEEEGYDIMNRAYPYWW